MEDNRGFLELIGALAEQGLIVGNVCPHPEGISVAIYNHRTAELEYVFSESHACDCLRKFIKERLG